ncbi:MAG: DNA-directed RNA polymerase subunit L [Methanomassiliicoccales archaeon]|nr:MAG: DNA-directed RNA polymerase subunit L [Methanomassiliicoccales archaeon]
MELRLLESKKTSAKIEVSEFDPTLLYPLMTELQNDKDVTEARFTTGHPQLDKPVIHVKVKKGKPQMAVKRAASKIAKEFKEARQNLEKQLK